MVSDNSCQVFTAEERRMREHRIIERSNKELRKDTVSTTVITETRGLIDTGSETPTTIIEMRN